MEEDIKNAIEIMKKGGVILYPTDTIWGIGCDATNEKAVNRIYEIKQRAENKAMLVLIDDINKIERYVEDVPDMAYSINELSEKPVTIIYEHAKFLAKNLLGDNDSVGIRVSRDEFSKKLCAKFGRPIVSTSANISGAPSAPAFKDIADDIKNAVDYIVKYRQDDNTEHTASSIIKLSKGNVIKIIRN